MTREEWENLTADQRWQLYTDLLHNGPKSHPVTVTHPIPASWGPVFPMGDSIPPYRGIQPASLDIPALYDAIEAERQRRNK